MMSALCARCLTARAQPQGYKVYSYFALGILMTVEMNDSDKTKIGFLQHIFLSLER